MWLLLNNCISEFALVMLTHLSFRDKLCTNKLSKQRESLGLSGLCFGQLGVIGLFHHGLKPGDHSRSPAVQSALFVFLLLCVLVISCVNTEQQDRSFTDENSVNCIKSADLFILSLSLDWMENLFSFSIFCH